MIYKLYLIIVKDIRILKDWFGNRESVMIKIYLVMVIKSKIIRNK